MEELIGMIVSQLGVNEGQAKGGAGLLFKLAQEHLGGADFARIAEAVGGIEDLIGAAPEAGGLGGLAGAVGGLLGGKAGELGGLAELAAGFKSLDLDAGDIGKFGEVIGTFLNGKGLGDIVGLIQGMLK